MREEEEKILVYGKLGIVHGHANIGTGRANCLEVGGWFWRNVARAVLTFWTS